MYIIGIMIMIMIKRQKRNARIMMGLPRVCDCDPALNEMRKAERGILARSDGRGDSLSLSVSGTN